MCTLYNYIPKRKRSVPRPDQLVTGSSFLLLTVSKVCKVHVRSTSKGPLTQVNPHIRLKKR